MKTICCALATVLLGCATTQEAKGPALPTVTRHQGRPVIAVVMPLSAETTKLFKGLSGELSEDFDVLPWNTDALATPAALGELISKEKPVAVVLVNNPTVTLYRAWQASAPAPHPAALILMAALADDLQKTVKNATGIAYEVPALSSVVGLRSVLNVPLRKVAVLHRAGFADFVEKQRQLAAIERIALVPFVMDETPTAGELSRTLKRVKAADVDALWVMNDNKLLQPDLFREGWFPFVDRERMPVLVGVSSLVRADRPFGTWGVIPDSEALGVQAANLLLELGDSGWRAGEKPVQLPVSVKTFLDVARAKPLGFEDTKRDRVDFAIESKVTP